MNTLPRGNIDLPGFDIRVIETKDLGDGDRAAAIALFQANYRQANVAYLAQSFTKLRHMAIASSEGTAAGFALGETRVIDLPRLPEQTVAMAGICCVGPAFRRRGLFGALERGAIGAGMPPAGAPGRILMTGRMAHPASYRTMSRNTGVVPRASSQPTRWQRAVGQAVADAYGSHGFDPETFVVIGSGTPIGYPVIEMELEPEEWKVFAPVNRDRGDSLLGLSWQPDPPDGWLDDDAPQHGSV